MSSRLSPIEIAEMYREVLRLDAYAETLNAYEKQAVLAHAEKQLSEVRSKAIWYIDKHPEFPYPPEVQKDRLIEYWEVKYFEYHNANKIIRLLSAPPNRTKTQTHRATAIAYSYKIEAKMAKELSRTEMCKLGGKALERAFDSINTKGKTFRSIKKHELEAAIELLRDVPTAQKAAMNDLDKLNNHP